MNGLVLVGGRSSRMGKDKSQLIYREKPQWKYLYELLEPFCEKVFLSCREQQRLLFPFEDTLIDSYEIGPLGGILSAFEYNSNTAWLVVACDMPFVNKETIEWLQKHRKKSCTATTFKNPETMLPEPLLTIWEPSVYPFLNEAQQQNQRSPLRILLNTKSNLINCPQAYWLSNVNTLEEYKMLMMNYLGK